MSTTPTSTPTNPPANPPHRRLRSVVGDATAKKLATLGLETIDDLLRHYPRRYVSLGEMTDLAALQVGQYATVMARVVEAVNRRFGPGGRKTRTEVTITDGNARITLTFFSQPWRQAQLAPGTVGLFAGEVGAFNGRLQLTHPLYEPLEGPDAMEGRIARGIIPIYRASAKIPSLAIERSVETVLAIADVEDPVPADVRASRGLPAAPEAFEMIHRPRSTEQWQLARDRFCFE
ncbi:MAG: ATP-dependent DNA helicase RecG, partial [Actinomycetales bacterium]